MNCIEGKIAHLETAGNLTIVTLSISGNITLKVIVVETPQTATYLQVGHQVRALFKETETVLATGDTTSLSIENKLTGKIAIQDHGALLSRLVIKTGVGDVVSVIGTASAARLKLQVGMQVTAMIDMNAIILAS